jgi:predicted phosphodiesterase
VRIPLVDGREVLMVHGSPADSHREISHDMSDEEILALMNDDPADIIVCGSTHVPFQRTVADYHVVNVGSVGAAPEGRVAHYTVLTPRLSSADILQDWVSYGEPEAS